MDFASDGFYFASVKSGVWDQKRAPTSDHWRGWVTEVLVRNLSLKISVGKIRRKFRVRSRPVTYARPFSCARQSGMPTVETLHCGTTDDKWHVAMTDIQQLEVQYYGS
jgi:hypothetical protein